MRHTKTVISVPGNARRCSRIGRQVAALTQPGRPKGKVAGATPQTLRLGPCGVCVTLIYQYGHSLEFLKRNRGSLRFTLNRAISDLVSNALQFVRFGCSATVLKSRTLVIRGLTQVSLASEVAIHHRVHTMLVIQGYTAPPIQGLGHGPRPPPRVNPRPIPLLRDGAAATLPESRPVLCPPGGVPASRRG